MHKRWVYILVFILCFQFPIHAIDANAENNSSLNSSELVLYSNSGSEIDVFNDSNMSELLFRSPNGAEISDLEKIDSEVSKVYISLDTVDISSVKDKNRLLNNKILIDDIETLEGYVANDLIIPVDQYESILSTRGDDTLDGMDEDFQDETKNNFENTYDNPEVPKKENENGKRPEGNIQTDDVTSNNKVSISSTQSITYVTVSRLGHIRNRNVDIYRELGTGDSFKAGSELTNAVYYIKQQANVKGEIYYLLSTRPSATQGIVGWAKSTDLSTHPHVGVDKNPKIFGIKGNGKATSKAWGGRKDDVHSSLSSFKGRTLHVDLTEKVGNNTWYRGKIDGQGPTVWLHSSYVEDAKESSTSRLGHIRNRNVQIYEQLGGMPFVAGGTYTNAVYYIKRQATVGSQLYYLLSTRPSATQGTIGWAKASDLSTHPHIGVDKNQKRYYITGKGRATSKAWGGSKDVVYPDMTEIQGKVLHVNLTEKVGNNTWYRGKVDGDGPNVWLHSNHVISANISTTSLLGHIKNRNDIIYEALGGNGFKAGATYTNTVYYIKQQANVKGEIYYLLSTRPSATQGIVGWAKSTDLSTHPHVGVDKNPKIFGIKGNGKATSKAWGGRKDDVHSSLSSFKGRTLHVDLTERVGNNTWYRGKIDGQGPTVWLHSSYVEAGKESPVSRLGHLKNRNIPIYKELGGNSVIAGSELTNAVYYIKRQTIVGNQKFYLLSTRPSATQGVIGWANKEDLTTHEHTGIDKERKLFLINGKGKATSKAWGGYKDDVLSNLTSEQGKLLYVDLTERVGNNVWYRGKINEEGPIVWLHSNYVTDINENSISRLGHIKSRDVKIRKDFTGKTFSAGSEYTNAVYYIKKEIIVDNIKYYLLSTRPSATEGVVGWAKDSDLSTHPHVGVSKQSRTLRIKGTGKAYSKAWGGSKDLVYGDMSQHNGKLLHINLTEKVGNNTWYRGKINGTGPTVWLHSSYLEERKVIFIDPGHGGSDPGALGNGLREKDITLEISKRVKNLLTGQGYHVIMSREDDTHLSLAERSKKANDANADLLVSIHINSGGGTGIETWWNDKNSHAKSSEQLAKDVQSEIIKSTNMRDRGVKGRGPDRGNFHMTREPKMPSALVEVGFIDTKSDADKLKNKNFLQRAAEGIVNGIKKFLS